MNGLAITFIILALIVGIVIGFFGARVYLKKYFKDNPPINQDMIRAMMLQMGQKPSQRKLNQIMTSMRNQQNRSNKK